MQDMRDLYKAYAAVHDTTIKEELDNSKDQITEMNLGQMTGGDLVEIAEEIIEGLFQYGLDLDEAYGVVGDILEEASDNIIGGRKEKIVRIAEAFEEAFDTVTDKAERNCEEAFLLYRKNKPLTEKWNNKVSHETGNAKIHASIIHEEREGVKLGLIEMISNLIEAAKGKVGGGDRDGLVKGRDAVSAGGGQMNSLTKWRGLGRQYTGDKSAVKKRADAQYKADRKAAAKEREADGTSNSKLDKLIKSVRSEEIGGYQNAYASIYEKKLDPVGQEDGDIDNDGDKDSSDKYLAKRRKAIGKAMGKKDMKEASDIQYPTGEKKKFTKDKSDPKVAAGRKAAKEMGLKHNEGVEFSQAELDRIQEIVNSWED